MRKRAPWGAFKRLRRPEKAGPASRLRPTWSCNGLFGSCNGPWPCSEISGLCSGCAPCPPCRGGGRGGVAAPASASETRRRRSSRRANILLCISFSSTGRRLSRKRSRRCVQAFAAIFVICSRRSRDVVNRRPPAFDPGLPRFSLRAARWRHAFETRMASLTIGSPRKALAPERL